MQHNNKREKLEQQDWLRGYDFASCKISLQELMQNYCLYAEDDFISKWLHGGLHKPLLNKFLRLQEILD